MQRERKTVTFEKFGMKFTMFVMQETRPQWVRQLKNKKGEVLDTSSVEKVKEKLEEGERPTVEWVKTDAEVTNSYVQLVKFSDDEGIHDRPVELFSTLDGPILGIVMQEGTEDILLADPCVIQYSQQNGSIQYLPIFNVAREMRLQRSAVRTRSAPAEIIVASYPGFILQNRMYQYQLKPKVPFEVTPELDNDADDPVTTEAG